MRLAERTLRQVHLARRSCKLGSLGGRAEGFSETLVPLRACVLPERGEMQTQANGLKPGEKLRLLVPVDAQVQPGDGVQMEEAWYRVMAVQRWTAHLELICEAIA